MFDVNFYQSWLVYSGTKDVHYNIFSVHVQTLRQFLIDKMLAMPLHETLDADRTHAKDEYAMNNRSEAIMFHKIYIPLNTLRMLQVTDVY